MSRRRRYRQRAVRNTSGDGSAVSSNWHAWFCENQRARQESYDRWRRDFAEPAREAGRAARLPFNGRLSSACTKLTLPYAQLTKEAQHKFWHFFWIERPFKGDITERCTWDEDASCPTYYFREKADAALTKFMFESLRT